MRRIRKERGLTQAELALATGLGPVQISRIERGVQEPRFATLERLAEALGVSVDAFWTFCLEPTSASAKSTAGESRDWPPYARSSRSALHRRLNALIRELEALDENVACAALEACISLSRELRKRVPK